MNHCAKNYRTTIEDSEAMNIQEYLETLGKEYHSDWLIQRGIYYQEYHKTKPQSWPPPTMIDWMYIKIMSQKEFEMAEVKNEYTIQVPN